VRQAVAPAVTGVVLAATLLTGCGPTPSCAGGENPPPVTVQLDARGWMAAHPSTAAIVACTDSYPCRRMPARLLTERPLFVGNAEGSSPRGAPVGIRLRVLTGSGMRILTAVETARPKITSETTPCGPSYTASAFFTLTAVGHLEAGR
jgi:hypothetical protein